MKRLSNDRDLFEAPAGETITVAVEAHKTPYQATFSNLESEGSWAPSQAPTPAQPVEKRQFKMPVGSREFFGIVYSFPPSDQTDPEAKYLITLSGGGATDGPNEIFLPVAGDVVNLSYEFRLPG